MIVARFRQWAAEDVDLTALRDDPEFRCLISAEPSPGP